MRDEASPVAIARRAGAAVVKRSGALIVVLLAAVAVGLTLQSRSPSPFAASPARNAPAVGRDAASSEDASEKAAVDQYAAGKYVEAERAALGVVEESPDGGEERARARWVLAFAAARRKDFPLARERFAELRKEAAAVPDVKLLDDASDSEATLEEEAAYQHAVLTLALASRSAGKGVQVFGSSGVQASEGVQVFGSSGVQGMPGRRGRRRATRLEAPIPR